MADMPAMATQPISRSPPGAFGVSRQFGSRAPSVSPAQHNLSCGGGHGNDCGHAASAVACRSIGIKYLDVSQRAQAAREEILRPEASVNELIAIGRPQIEAQSAVASREPPGQVAGAVSGLLKRVD